MFVRCYIGRAEFIWLRRIAGNVGEEFNFERGVGRGVEKALNGRTDSILVRSYQNEIVPSELKRADIAARLAILIAVQRSMFPALIGGLAGGVISRVDGWTGGQESVR